MIHLLKTSLQTITTSKTRYLKVKLDCLQQNSFQSHHLLSWILINIIVIRADSHEKVKILCFCWEHLLESAELSIIGQTPDSLDQIPERIESKKENNQKVRHSLALLRGFLSLASQEQNTGSSDLDASLNKFRVLIATYISWKLLETMFHVESERKPMLKRHR